MDSSSACVPIFKRSIHIFGQNTRISLADEEFLDATCVSDTYATDETMSSKKKNQKTFLRHSSLHSILIGY